MSEPFLGEIKIISWNFPPKGWAFCNGQLLPINENQALFLILGTTYGGDGRQTFGLPNLQGRMPVHVGNGIVLGQLAGETAHTLNIGEIPAHTHFLAADPAAASSDTPDPAGGKALAQSSGSGGSPPAPFQPISQFSRGRFKSRSGMRQFHRRQPATRQYVTLPGA